MFEAWTVLVRPGDCDVVRERHSSGVDVVDQLEIGIVFDSVDPQVVLDVERAARVGSDG